MLLVVVVEAETSARTILPAMSEGEVRDLFVSFWGKRAGLYLQYAWHPLMVQER